jgi:DNA-binding transcriptional MocR family regulator
MTVDPGQLLVTNGASQALDLVCTLFARAGESILVEEPTYFLARRIFADHRLQPVTVPMDEEGIDLSALQEALTRQPARVSLHHPHLPQPEQHLPLRCPARAAHRAESAP